MAYLYRHIRLDNNTPFYIGIGNDISYKRSKLAKCRNIFWKRIVNKTEYEIEIVLDNLTWEEACKKEKEFIKLYGRKDLGLGTLTNLTDGGEGQFNPSNETRLKMKYVKSKEHREKLSIAKLGENNPFFNKKRKEHSIWMKNNHPNKKSILQLDKNGSFIKEWESARKVYQILNIEYKNISACCYGKRKTAGGYVWKFKN